MKPMNIVKKYGAVVALLAPGAAMAELPAGIQTGLTSIQTDGLALADMVWPVLLALLGAGILMKLGKRFFNKI